MRRQNPLNPELYQIIASEVCFWCDVCCRFLEVDRPLAPIFTKEVVLGVDTLCPFGEAHFETEAFQRHIDDVINYVESEEVTVGSAC